MGEEIKYYRRYHGYDYSKGASLFVTMATEPRKALFGRVENATVVLSDLGRLVLESMESMPRFNPGGKFRSYSALLHEEWPSARFALSAASCRGAFP